MSPNLSIILPAFNEAERLPACVVLIRSYLEHAFFSSQFEVVVVDDGSQDATRDQIGKTSGGWSKVRVLPLGQNFGKGRALRTGVAAARGNFILLADADGAAPIAEEANLRQAILDGADIAIGSRRLGTGGIERSWCRNLIGAGFAWLVKRMFDLPIRDTQCGFKMFRGEVAQRLFGMCREDGFLIDVEVLLHAHRLGYKIVEVPVAWRDVPGSKVRLFRDGWRMLTGLWRLRRRFKETTKKTKDTKEWRELENGAGPAIGALDSRPIP